MTYARSKKGYIEYVPAIVFDENEHDKIVVFAKELRPSGKRARNFSPIGSIYKNKRGEWFLFLEESMSIKHDTLGDIWLFITHLKIGNVKLCETGLVMAEEVLAWKKIEK